MKDKSEKLIEMMKKSRMTAVEKARMKLDVMAAIERMNVPENSPVSPYAPARSPYFFRFSYSAFGKMASVAVLIFMIGMGGLSYASSSALPGDFLYPVKINVKEKIEEGLAFTPEKAIALRQKRIEDRFVEVEKLIDENRITPEIKSTAEIEIQMEKQKIASDIEEINKENPGAALEAKVELEANIQERQESINSTMEESSDVDSIDKELETLGASIDMEIDSAFSEEVPAPTPSEPAPLE